MFVCYNNTKIIGRKGKLLYTAVYVKVVQRKMPRSPFYGCTEDVLNLEDIHSSSHSLRHLQGLPRKSPFSVLRSFCFIYLECQTKEFR